MATEDGITRVIRVQIDATQAYGVTDKISKNVDQMNNSFQKMQSNFNTLARAWGLFKASTLGWQGIKGVVEASDALKQLTATFDVLMPAAAGGADMMERLLSISTNLGTKLEDTAKIAQRFAVALGQFGATNDQVAQLTANVLMLGRIGGSSMADAAEGARQLGQAMASGKLQGDELRSIMERIPLVGQEIANSMGVAAASLKELGSKGAITTQDLFKALLKNTDEIAAKFAKLPFTFEQSLNRMATQWTVFLASFDKMSGFGTTLTTIFVYLGSIMSYITSQLKQSGEELNGWQIVVRGIGDAFKGIVIVVAALVTGLQQAFTAATGLFNAFKKAATGDFVGAWDEIKNASKTALEQGSNWKTFANDIALGTQSIGKSTKEVNDFMKDYQKVLDEMRKGMKSTGKDAEAAAKAIQKFKDSIRDMFIDFAQGPEKIKILKEAMDQVNTSTEAGVRLYEELRSMLEKIEPPTAAVEAIREVEKAMDEATRNQDKLTGLLEAMMELEAVGEEGSNTWIAYKKAYMELMQKMDETGAIKAVEDIKKMVIEAQNLQAQFDAVNAAVERGDIAEAWAENWKRTQLQVSESTKKIKTDIEEMAEQFGKMSKKFTSEFADKLVENIGKVDAAWGDFVEDFLKSIAKIMVNAMFQKFIKTMATMGAASGGPWASFFQAILGSATGNAWRANGVEYMASGGILNSPTLFTNMGRLAVAGEAGPEAVVPLQRAPNGNLGVAASPVNIEINNSMADQAQVTVASNDNADGSKQIQIYVEQKVKAMFSSGQMDRTMSSSYGLTRQPR